MFDLAGLPNPRSIANSSDSPFDYALGGYDGALEPSESERMYSELSSMEQAERAVEEALEELLAQSTAPAYAEAAPAPVPEFVGTSPASSNDELPGIITPADGCAMPASAKLKCDNSSTDNVFAAARDGSESGTAYPASREDSQVPSSLTTVGSLPREETERLCEAWRAALSGFDSRSPSPDIPHRNPSPSYSSDSRESTPERSDEEVLEIAMRLRGARFPLTDEEIRWRLEQPLEVFQSANPPHGPGTPNPADNRPYLAELRGPNVQTGSRRMTWTTFGTPTRDPEMIDASERARDRALCEAIVCVVRSG